MRVESKGEKMGGLPPDAVERLRKRLCLRTPLLGVLSRWRGFSVVEARIRGCDTSVVPLLVLAAELNDSRVSRRARKLLWAIENPTLVDALCEEATRVPDSTAARICRERNLRPSDPEQACLFLFVTRQLEEYFREDYEFQNLRLAYDRADPVVQGNVMRVVRSGDRRCLDFFGARKRLSDCNEREIFLALHSFLSHQDWPRLFQAFLELPVKYGFHILKRLRHSGWEPEDPELRSLLRQALRDVRHQVAPLASRSQGSSPPFERALEAGKGKRLEGLGEDDLLKRLRAVDPLEAVPIVVRLASMVAPDSRAGREVASSPHWLVRLAGYASGLCTDVVHDEIRDDNYWVRTLAPSRSVLELWPGKATPAHLEALRMAPPEGWEGGLGAARRLLRLLVASRLTVGRFEELVVEGEAFAGEFEPASELEWVDDPSSSPAEGNRRPSHD